MVKTTDGGNTWQPLFKKTRSIIGMSFISANIGYIVIDLHEGNVVETTQTGAELLKTTDGGNTGTSINNKIYEDFNIVPFQCYFADEQHGFMCGSYLKSKIISTSDGGKTWKEEYTGTSSNYFLNKIIFTSSKIGYAIGNNGLLIKRIVY
ncbi:MAG: YCF48-related protein [Bacteroidota bacterium]|nr:YCF48-related protein [Bacteroidota bacterium]